MGKISCVLLFFLLFSLGISGQIALETRLVQSGFDRPTDIVALDTFGLLIAEKGGTIRFFDPAGTKAPGLALDLRNKVKGINFEEGLLGMAIHPAFPDSNYLYVHYMDWEQNSRIARFTVETDSTVTLLKNSEKEILSFPQPNHIHNAGALAFGPDGMLYIALGDGDAPDDPLENGQNLQTIYGAILRLDIDAGDPYAIPDDNPFAGDTLGREEIWSYGLRNPWRISFDRLTGDLWIGDVGQWTWEEINFQPAGSKGGENYGWDCFEAGEVFEDVDCPEPANVVFPVFFYLHNEENGCSVTGGYVYRGDSLSGRQGQYFLGDWCTGRIWALSPDGQGGFLSEIVLDTGEKIMTFGEDHAGELYFASEFGDLFVFAPSQVSDLDRLQPFESMQAFPNPFASEINIELETNSPGIFEFSIFNALGQEVRSWKNWIGRSYFTTVDLSEFPANAYFLRISSNGFQHTRLIRKE